MSVQRLLQLIKYKTESEGIKVKFREESYKVLVMSWT